MIKEKPLLQIERTNTILYCRAFRETAAFYRGVLSLPVSFENEWFVEFLLADSSYLSVADAARATVSSAGGEGITLTWSVADLEGARAALAARGVDTSPIRRRWNARVFYFSDPEGHRIECWTPEAG